MRKKIENIDELVAGAFLVFLVVLVSTNVIARYVFNHVFNWAEELATLSFIWCTYIAIAAAFKQNKHIAIDIIVNLFPEPLQKVIDILINILLLVMNIGITYLAILLTISSKGKPTPILRISYSYVNISLVISFGLMAIYGFMDLIKKIKSFNVVSEQE